MSADNWTKCPVCRADAIRAKRELQAEAKEKYGKVPVEEFDSLRRAAELPLPDEDRLREDYEIGVDETGIFEVSYSCYCTSCSWRFEFKARRSAI